MRLCAGAVDIGSIDCEVLVAELALRLWEDQVHVGYGRRTYEYAGVSCGGTALWFYRINGKFEFSV